MPGEIGHCVQSLGEDGERDAEFQIPVVPADEVREKELADSEGLFLLN